MTDTLRVHDHVETAKDLPGIPMGTVGDVTGVTGLSWLRYRVRFVNGIERNLIDGGDLRPLER